MAGGVGGKAREGLPIPSIPNKEIFLLSIGNTLATALSLLVIITDCPLVCSFSIISRQCDLN